ncbi:MAG: SAM-dependent methyltransferase [Hyphococcus sp.]|nr:MAG: SAM-dependent methyltransferase [Marinicaulis sp.]
MEDIVDRLETIKRDFPLAVFSGANDLTSRLTKQCGVGNIIHLDLAANRLPENGARIVCDEEQLCLAPQSIDLFVSLLTLHNTNDLIGALAQARVALKPDGLFIAVLFGDETLKNLRTALLTAEAKLTSGAAARVAPMGVIQDFGQALSRAGFALPVTDIDNVKINYRSPQTLLQDLRGMAETNVLAGVTKPLRRDVLAQSLNYFEQAGCEEKFDLIFLTGWAPDDSQQKPLKPGSAKTSLADAIKDQ